MTSDQLIQVLSIIVVGLTSTGGATIVVQLLKGRKKKLPEKEAQKIEVHKSAEMAGISLADPKWDRMADDMLEQNRLIWSQLQETLQQNALLRAQLDEMRVKTAAIEEQNRLLRIRIATTAATSTQLQDYVDILRDHINAEKGPPPPPMPQ